MRCIARLRDVRILVVFERSDSHVVFGWGVHACVGSAFGQLALQALVAGLLDAPALRLMGRPVCRHTAPVRWIAEMPVSFAESANEYDALADSA